MVLSLQYLSFCPPGESDPTDPALFLGLLLYTDLTAEEMFCLILKCEEMCGRPAKSHYSPPSEAALYKANSRGRKERGRQREKMFILSDRRVTEIPNTVIVIKVNWLQLAG